MVLCLHPKYQNLQTELEMRIHGFISDTNLVVQLKVFYKNQLTQKADTILAERLGVFYKKQVMQRAFE